MRRLWAEAEIASTNYGVFRVAPAVGAGVTLSILGVQISLPTDPRELRTYAGSEIWRRVNQAPEMRELLELAGFALGPFGAAYAAPGGAIEGVRRCGWWNVVPGASGACAAIGALGAGAPELTRNRIDEFFDPRQSWGTYEGATCLY